MQETFGMLFFINTPVNASQSTCQLIELVERIKTINTLIRKARNGINRTNDDDCQEKPAKLHFP